MFFSPNIYLFILAFFYASILLIVPIIIFDKFGKSVAISRNKILLVFFLAFFIRFFPVVFFPFASGYDISSFLWAAQRVLDGKDIYWGLPVRHHFAFMPTFAILTAWFLNLSLLTKIPTVIFMKLLVIIFDSLIAVLISLISKNLRNGLLYATSLIPVMVGAYFGQFDPIPLFFSVLGLYLFFSNKPFLSMLNLGIGTTFKPWPAVFALPLLFSNKGRRRKRTMLIFFALPLGLVILIYKIIIPSGNLFTMIGAIALYESVIGWWGPSILFQKLSDFLGIRKIVTIPSFISKILTISIIFYICYICKNLRNKNVFLVAKLIILAVYIFSFGFAIQYLLWIFPFALITKDRFTKHYVLFVGSYFILSGIMRLLTYNFEPPGIPNIFYVPLSFLLWSFFLAWGIKEVQSTL